MSCICDEHKYVVVNVNSMIYVNSRSDPLVNCIDLYTYACMYYDISIIFDLNLNFMFTVALAV